MASIANLSLQVSANTGRATKNLRKVSKSVTSVGASMKRAAKGHQAPGKGQRGRGGGINVGTDACVALYGPNAGPVVRDGAMGKVAWVGSRETWRANYYNKS